MIKILKLQPIDPPIYVCPTDSFTLLVNGEVVHKVDINRFERISHWALIEIAGGLGYIIGDDTLPARLQQMAGGA